MEGRQRRRLTWPRIIVSALVLADSGAGWWLHQHNHIDIKAALVVVCMFLGTLVIVASLVICHQVASNHELTRAHQARLRELEDAADNVVSIRQRTGEDTMVLPFVAVGRAHPVVTGGVVSSPIRSLRQLSYTSGDHTIDCYINDVIEEGDTG